MKNTLVISNEGEQLLSSINDGSNRLFINGTEIDSSEWVGNGNYTKIIEGHTVTIQKVDKLEDNIILVGTSDYNYELKKISMQLYPAGKDGVTPRLMINSDGHLIAIYE